MPNPGAVQILTGNPYRFIDLDGIGFLKADEIAMRMGWAKDSAPRAEAILKQINSNAPLAVKLSIEAVNRGSETSQAEGLVIESSFFAICAATEDKKEGTSAFLEKRAAKFQGR